jgi:phosphopantothenoylcysteine decarboxylase/phosphopantothenate--cysteine ligase
MGLELAKEAYLRGAEVTLVMGNTTLRVPRGIHITRVETTEDMYRSIMSKLKNDGYDVFIGAAAPVDFRPSEPKDYKLDSRESPILKLELVSTPKIIEDVRKTSDKLFVVAFKAVYNLSDDEIVEKALEYIKTQGFEIVVANDVSREGIGFGREENEVFVIEEEGLIEHIPITSKREIASKLMNIIKDRVSK